MATWTKREEKHFAALLFAMGEAFNESVSAERVELYCGALEDLPSDRVMAAAREHLKHSRFFPKPVDLRDLVEGNVGDQAEVAWQQVLREIRRVGYMGVPAWPDEATKRAALGLFGGTWSTLCENLPSGRDETGPALLGFRKQFLAAYTAAARGEAVLLGGDRASARQQLGDLKRALDARGLPAPGLDLLQR